MQSEADIALGMDHIQRRLARLYKQAYKVKCCFPFLHKNPACREEKVLIFKQCSGSGSDFLSLKNNVNVPSKSNKQIFFLN